MLIGMPLLASAPSELRALAGNANFFRPPVCPGAPLARRRGLGRVCGLAAAPARERWPSDAAKATSTKPSGRSNQVGHFWFAGQLELMNEFLLLAVGVGHSLVLAQMLEP
jgi:hypothetical protein